MRPLEIALSLCLTIAALFVHPEVARAVPGPDTTAILANANVAESVTLADRYGDARQIPRGQRCALPIDETVDLTLSAFRAQVLDPLDACLEASGASDRIEAIVIARGVPLRVVIPTAGGDRRVSLAAALAVSRTTEMGEPLLDHDPSMVGSCGGGPCQTARVVNPFRAGSFESGWTRTSGSFEHHPLLVTMLHGRTYEDAGRLIESALAAETMGGARGELLFMNGADMARGVLDAEYDRVISDLSDRGFTDVARVPFDANTTGHALAAFFTGTASLGETIEGNTYHPGAIVDNLTSFGAVPQNFEATGESQVSIARWVAMGVAGVHGTTDEPLNNCFPSRRLVVDYVDGSTLAEAYHRNLPYAYWMNLVLGDAMVAPYAVRPMVAIEGVTEGDTIGDARMVRVTATDPEGLGVDSLALFLDGDEVARVEGDALELCLAVPAGFSGQLLAVAQKHDDGSPRGLHRPKGWLALEVVGAGGSAVCAPPDAGTATDDAGTTTPPADAGVATDAGPSSDDGAGCACTIGEPRRGDHARTRHGLTALALVVAVTMRVRRGRVPRSSPSR